MGYIGLYHRFKVLPEGKYQCAVNKPFKDDKVLSEYSLQSCATIHASEKLFLKTCTHRSTGQHIYAAVGYKQL